MDTSIHYHFQKSQSLTDILSEIHLFVPFHLRYVILTLTVLQHTHFSFRLLGENFIRTAVFSHALNVLSPFHLSWTHIILLWQLDLERQDLASTDHLNNVGASTMKKEKELKRNSMWVCGLLWRVRLNKLIFGLIRITRCVIYQDYIHPLIPCHEPHICNTQPLDPILGQMNPDHTLILFLCKSNFNIILLSKTENISHNSLSLVILYLSFFPTWCTVRVLPNSSALTPA